MAGVATVIGMYVATALLHTAPVVPATTVIVVAAVVMWCALGDAAGAVCGAIAATAGPIAEIGLVQLGVFAYTPGSDGLFGVGPFLVPLYFAFGVVVAALSELAAAGQSRDSDRLITRR